MLDSSSVKSIKAVNKFQLSQSGPWDDRKKIQKQTSKETIET